MAYGSALSAAEDTPSARKARGAFYTPPELASFVARWAIRSLGDHILEPACGEAEFLVAAFDRLQSLGCKSAVCARNIVGFEVHKASAEKAAERLRTLGCSAEIAVSDFLRLAPDPSFDAVIGNPPYVRFQSLSSDQKDAIGAIAERHGIAVSSLSSLWMPFVLQAVSFLKVGGRLGLVLPAELLTVNYAAPLRSFLMASFSSVRLATFDEPVFPEVQEEVVLLLADGWKTGSCSAITWQQCDDASDLASDKLALYQPPSEGARWSGLFASGDSLSSLNRLTSAGEFVPLSQWGTLSLGAVTGNNGFFVLNQSEFEQWGLGSDDVLRLCPPGSRHLRRLAYTEKDERAAVERGAGVYLFRPGADPSEAAQRYIAYGEDLGVQDAYKCRVRSPWWRVPVGQIPDAFVTYMNAYGPNICANDAKVRILNSCHSLFYHSEIDEAVRSLLPIASLNSATMFGAEITGRAYGGGMLKLEPREASQLAVPSSALVASCANDLRAVAPYVEKLLEKRDYDGAISLVDAVLIPRTSLQEVSFVQMKSNATLMRLRRKKRAKFKKVG